MVLKVTPLQFAEIRSKMLTKTSKKRAARNNFSLSKLEREMLEELKDLLEHFERVTDEFQTDSVSISIK
jgi:hypothetical protein